MSGFQPSSIVSTIYKSRKNLLAQLQKQGYDISNYDEFNSHEVHIMVQNKQLDLLLEKDDKKIYIKYFITKSLRNPNVLEMIDELFNLEQVLSKNDRLLIISKDDPNDTLTNLMKHLYSEDNIYVTINSLKSLMYNVLDHEIVPTHIILSNKQKEEFRQRYNILLDTQIPQISRFDPVALAIGIRPGQVCSIIRKSSTSISGIYYRLCINN